MVVFDLVFLEVQKKEKYRSFKNLFFNKKATNSHIFAT